MPTLGAGVGVGRKELAPQEVGAVAQGRSLATARAVLQILDDLLAEPDGLTTSEVARLIGKTPSTTRYLLNSLCQEGFGFRSGQRYWAAPSIQRVSSSATVANGHIPQEHMEDALAELSKRTRQRAYLAQADPEAEIADVLGHQGQPILPGVGPSIKRQLHALAIGKVLLANLPEGAVQAYVEGHGLHAFTRATIVEPDPLLLELRQVRSVGYGLDLEECTEGFCCVAAPLFDTSGKFAGAIGVSATSKTFSSAGPSLIEAVTAVARLSPVPA
jgi:DNA-binding IclR family transcriptional regulator